MTAIGAIIGLLLAIFLIIKKIAPAYAMITGAVVGGLLGGFSLADTVGMMIEGINDLSSAILRVLAAGVLSGVLIATGAAETISNSIVRVLGEKQVYLALALSTMLLCAAGVFIDVAVITVAPIALTLGSRLGISRAVLLIAMIGGGKCGNIISPNPNTIIAAENFGASMSTVIFYNLLPATIGLIFTVFLVKLIPQKNIARSDRNTETQSKNLPPLWSSLMAPIVTLLLLSARPLLGYTIDPLIAMPAGGLVGILCMKQWKNTVSCMTIGLQKMSGVAILLIGTGTIAGIIKSSSLKDWILQILSDMNISDALIAPISGALMSAATASTTAGATLASASFADTLLSLGISAAWGAAMVNSGATVLDHLPHGSFFHATGGVCELTFRERLRLIPYECLIGGVLAVLSTLLFMIIH